MKHFYGLDLGLKTGGLVRATFNGQAVPVKLAEWTRGPNFKRVSVTEACSYIHQQVCVSFIDDLANFSDDDHLWVAIDWDPTDAFWGHRTNAVYKAFMAGYLYRFFATYKATPVFVPPRIIRTFLTLNPKSDKEMVWEAFEAHTGFQLNDNWTSHTKDGLVLAYFLKEMSLGTGVVDGTEFLTPTTG